MSISSYRFLLGFLLFFYSSVSLLGANKPDCSKPDSCASKNPLCLAPASNDLTNLGNVTQAFEYVKCLVEGCTQRKILMQSLFDQFFGPGAGVDFSNVTIDFPFRITQELVGFVDVTVFGTAPLEIKKIRILNPGDLINSQCGGTTITMKNNRLNFNITVQNTAIGVQAEALKIPDLTKGDLILSISFDVNFEVDVSVAKNSDGTILINSSIPLGTVQLTKPELKCTNNLKIGPGIAAATAAAAVQASAAACIVSPPTCPVAGPAAAAAVTISFPSAAKIYLTGDDVCSKIQDKFTSFVTQENIAAKLNGAIQKVFNQRNCRPATDSFGLNCQ